MALLALYAFGQPWELRGYISDVRAATIPGWHFSETGSWDLSLYQDEDVWFVPTADHGVRSNRTPGIIAVATIGYALARPLTDGSQNWPGILLAVLTSWLATLVVAATERLQKGLWLPTIVLFGLGTATFGVSAEQLWPHGPAQLAIHWPYGSLSATRSSRRASASRLRYSSDPRWSYSREDWR